MKFLHRIVGLVLFVLMVAVGIMMFTEALSVVKWESFISAVAGNRIYGLSAGVLLLCFAFLYAVTALPAGKKPKYLSFDRDGGTVSISTDAIAEYILKLASEFPSVVKMKPRVIPLRNSVDIVVEVNVKASPQIHEACGLLQDRIRESLVNGLGITHIRSVEVSVGEIVSEHKPG